MHFVLIYEYVADVLEKRGPLRAGHLSLAREYHEAGKLRMAGAFDPPNVGALFVFDVDSSAEVEEFVARDPYVSGGVVTRHSVKPWNLVIGG